MSGNQSLLFDAVDRPFAQFKEQGQSGWSAELAELGFDQLFVAEAKGGFGGDWEDALVVLKQLGRYGIEAPLAETMAVSWVLATSDLDITGGPFSVAQGFQGTALPRDDGVVSLSGELVAVGWSQQVSDVLVEVQAADQQQILLVPNPRLDSQAVSGHEAVALPVDQIDAAVIPAKNCVGPYMLGALVRVGVAAGALNHVLELSVKHANEREQFGKPIGKFQAIQQNLAVLAGEVAAANCAAAAAFRALGHGDAGFEIAAAKLRVNRAITEATAIAHQTHGAIGVTQEHELHKVTQQLWRWRQDFGNNRHWSRWLGRVIQARGGQALWRDLTARGDR